MRVVHIAPAVFGEDGVVGGAERYALELAKYMERPPSAPAWRDLMPDHFRHPREIHLAGGGAALSGYLQRHRLISPPCLPRKIP